MTTSYLIEGGLYDAETTEEAKALYIASLEADGLEAPAPDMIYAEVFQHCYAIVNNCYEDGHLSDILNAADRALPAGFHDTTWDDDHRLVVEEIRVHGRTYQLEADVIDWEPDYGYDPAGEYGSFSLGTVYVKRVH